MIEEINKKITESIKAGDDVALMIYKEIKTALIYNDKSKTPKSEIDIIKMLVKQHEETKESLIDPLVIVQEDKQIGILSQYLPKQMTEEEIKQFFTDHIEEGSTMRDMGKYMKLFNEKHPGQDGKLVSSIIKLLLQ